MKADYLNRSSKALRADVGAVERVSRSTVTLGENQAQALRASFGVIRAGMGWVHSKRWAASNDEHCAQECRSAPHREQRESTAMASGMRFAQRAHFVTS